MSLRSRVAKLPAVGAGLRAAWDAGYGVTDLGRDILAGLTIGTVAVPLSMALAIATGVPPQHGLYTAIIAGVVIALTGGSRFNVSGPTAAFVVILFPIVQQYGMGGLMMATMMAGCILVALGITGTGRLIRFVPHPVILGFTAGIGVVIAVLQIPDFLGLRIGGFEAHFIDNLARIVRALPSLQGAECAIGVFTLAVLLAWPRLRLPVPAPLVGLIAGAVAAWLVNQLSGSSGIEVATIASRFSWEAAGQSGSGIPPVAPSFIAPWDWPGVDARPIDPDFALVRALLGPAFAIAMLAAIESLLCAAVSDGLTRTRHDPNAELIGQGLGNIIAPLFGGITATAAIARTATSIRSGARSPIAAMVHGLVVLLAVVGLAGLLGMVPMASLSALLLVVAWNMSEPRLFLHTLRWAPAEDVAVLVLCFVLTVVFDMVLAVAVGIALAGTLFIRRMARTTIADRVDTSRHPTVNALPSQVALYDINGPLFFGAAEKALTSLRRVDPQVRIIIVDMHDVPSIDSTAIVALRTTIDEMNRQDVSLILTGLSARTIVTLRRAGIRKRRRKLSYSRNLLQAYATAIRWCGTQRSPSNGTCNASAHEGGPSASA